MTKAGAFAGESHYTFGQIAAIADGAITIG